MTAGAGRLLPEGFLSGPSGPFWVLVLFPPPCLPPLLLTRVRLQQDKRLKSKVHHAFPNAVGTLSQRGRFHGWEKVLRLQLSKVIWPPPSQ